MIAMLLFLIPLGLGLFLSYAIYRWEKADDARRENRRLRRSDAMKRADDRLFSARITPEQHDALYDAARRMK